MSKLLIDFEEGRADREVSSFELSRYRAGELSADRRKEIEALLASDATLQAELDELAAEDAAFRTRMPFDRFAADHAARREAHSPAARATSWLKQHVWRATGGLVAATAAALVLVLVVPQPGGGGPSVPGADSAVRIKGTRIAFFVQDDGAARIGRDGEQLREGDRIQLAVKDPAGRSAMVVVGIDGRGSVSTYAAAPVLEGTIKGEGEGESRRERARLLEQSLVLDDAVGAERFFVVYGTGDVDALRTRVEDAAHKLAGASSDLAAAETLPLDKSVEQYSVHIVKVPGAAGDTR